MKIIIWTLGIIIITLSFFISEENDFSTVGEKKEELYKNNDLTKLTILIYRIYSLLTFIFILLIFFIRV